MATLLGTSGNDTLSGGADADSIDGLAGNDSLIPGTGIDTVNGGAGSDTLFLIGAFAAYTVTQPDASSLRLVSVALDQDVTVVDIESVGFSDSTRSASSLLAPANSATGFDDSLTGTPGPDTIDGLGGNDTIEGLAGDDWLHGGSGVNRLFGGEGNDTVENGGREEHGSLLDGGAGNDLLRGAEDAAETFIGGAGDDRIIGGQHRDRARFSDQNTASYADAPGPITVNFSALTGEGNANGGLVSGHGNDTLDAIQRIIGSAFADTMSGSAQRTLEVFEGGLGDDSIDGGPLLTDGRADNRADYASASAAIHADLAAGTVSGGAGNDQLARINAIWATSFDDTLAGSDRDPGIDTFIPGAGNDRIEGRGGADFVRYDLTPGAAPVIADLASGIVSDGLGGTDTLVGIEGVAGAALDDSFSGSDDPGVVEHFFGGAGNDTIDGRGGIDWAHYDFAPAAVAVTLGGAAAGVGFDGEGGSDVLIGVEAVEGSAFDDSLTGSDSATLELFVGGSGADTIDGRGGPDEVSYERGSSEDAGSFGITLDLNTGFVTSRDLSDRLFGIEHATGTRLRDDVLVGNALGNRFSGLGGDDYFESRGGDDTLLGGDGDDTLIGGTGRFNHFTGGAGSDRIDGGASDPGSIAIDIARYPGEVPVVADLAAGTAAQGSDSDTLIGLEAVFGSNAGDTLRGAGGAAMARGETLRGGGGDDSLDGASGVDSAEYTGARGGFTVQREPATGRITVTDNDSSDGTEGTDRLDGIERVVFADRMLAFGERAEELARVAMVLWSPAILESSQLFCRGFSFYDVGYDFVTMSTVALQFWTAEEDEPLAQRLIDNSGSSKTVPELLQIIAAQGSNIAGRAAAVREIANDAATLALVEASGIRTHGVAADLFAVNFGQLFDLLPAGT